jgi:hypothetical protein
LALPGGLGWALDDIDKIAVDERRTRGNVVRILLEDALEARKSQK